MSKLRQASEDFTNQEIKSELLMNNVGLEVIHEHDEDHRTDIYDNLITGVCEDDSNQEEPHFYEQ